MILIDYTFFPSLAATRLLFTITHFLSATCRGKAFFALSPRGDFVIRSRLFSLVLMLSPPLGGSGLLDQKEAKSQGCESYVAA